MEYDLGYFDLETLVLEPLENPFGPKVSPMSPGRPAKLVGLGGFEPPTRSLGNCCSIHLSYSPTSEVIVARGFGVSALGRHRHSLQGVVASSEFLAQRVHCGHLQMFIASPTLCDARWPGWFCGPRPTRAGFVARPRRNGAAKCRVR